MSETPAISVRRQAVACWALVVLVASGFLSGARASEQRETKDFASIAARVGAYVEQFGADHVLLALDIDNTIMSMNTDLGSDHWFEWQSALLKTRPKSPFLVARDFEGLLEVQGTLYNLSRMHPPQKDLPAIVARTQKHGIATILLTSRGPEFRVATERELDRCGYDFARTELEVRDVPNGLFLAYDPSRPEDDGLSPQEIVKHELVEPRPVSYVNGVFMTAGQHKGMMLLTLLHHADRDIKAVVYADDNPRHLTSVFAAAADRNIEITTFDYQREDARVRRFTASDKCDVYCRWLKLRRTLEEVFQ